MLKDHAEATKSVESSMSKVANDNLQRAHDYIIFWRVVWTIERNIGLIGKCKTEKEMIEDIKLSKVILKSAEQLNVMYEPQEQFKQGVEQYARSLSKLCFANLHLYRKNYNAALHFARTAREIMPAYEGEFDHVILTLSRF